MAELDALRRELDQRVRITSRRLANEWERELRRTNPVDTGNMRDKTTVREQVSAGGVRVVAVVDTDYAIYVSEGTRPHIIRPRPPRKALRFTVGGRVVYAAKVNHPGTRPNPWFRDSVRRLPEMVQRIWRSL